MRNQVLPYEAFLETLRDEEVEALKANPVLVVCNDVECSDKMASAVRRRGLEVICCASVSDARSLLSRSRFSLIFSSEVFPDGEIHSVIEVAAAIPVVVLSRRPQWEAYLDPLNHGALDYIACSLDSGESERIVTDSGKSFEIRSECC